MDNSFNESVVTNWNFRGVNGLSLKKVMNLMYCTCIHEIVYFSRYQYLHVL